MREFVTKDSGERQQFASGMQRDTQDGKPRYDLIPPKPLRRLAELYGRGARKYNEWNWSKGSEYSRFVASAMRHLMQYVMGERDEDHLAAVCFNVMAIMHFDEMGMDHLNDLESRYGRRPDPEPVPPPLTFWGRIKLAVFVLTGWGW
jgi:hypothetical protein